MREIVGKPQHFSEKKKKKMKLNKYEKKFEMPDC